jgi:hypothetical protein
LGVVNERRRGFRRFSAPHAGKDGTNRKTVKLGTFGMPTTIAGGNCLKRVPWHPPALGSRGRTLTEAMLQGR